MVWLCDGKGRVEELSRRHCERSEAIQGDLGELLDCFASLAMTVRVTQYSAGNLQRVGVFFASADAHGALHI